jgi:excinuclease ABC subunit A
MVENLMELDKIIVRGARQHNLKNIDVDLPRNRLIVITGLSGSGKSTLAFDTLYAEGQRRYVESLSVYARQFLERMEKPEADQIEGLSPAIAIEQKSASHNPRSTVGTVTEIYDYLRLLFARVGTAHCYRCHTPIASQSLDQLVDRIMACPENTRTLILAPVSANRPGTPLKVINNLRKQGFARVRIDNRIYEIDALPHLERGKHPTIEVVVDRLIIRPSVINRLADSLELALAQSDGKIIVEILADPPQVQAETIRFNEKAECPNCGISYPEFTPASFSFNSPQGACPACGGLGVTHELDPDLIVPNPSLSLREGAVVVWANRRTLQFIEFLEAFASRYDADIYTPFEHLPARFKQVLFHGSEDKPVATIQKTGNPPKPQPKPFEGLIPNLARRYLETDSPAVRDEIRQYMTHRPCADCGGSRLRIESRSVKLGDLTIPQVASLSIAKVRAFFENLQLTGKQAVIAERILREINSRLQFLMDVGLPYLTLDRSAITLSGGESQRIRLATQIGSRLTGVLYVLDEPSIGLHQRDNLRLLKTLKNLRDLGNTVLVVEHDQEAITEADHVVDMGPGAGVHGGQVVFSGTPADLLDAPDSITGQYLSGKRRIDIPCGRRSGDGRQICILGACQNNLKNIDITFPLGCLVCVTGVSGSGKSTLVLETLHQAMSQHLGSRYITAGRHAGISGLEHVDKVINIDQSPIGRTPRSNPGTYTGLFNFIRQIFSRTTDARMRGYKPGRFSFNVKGGRCESCSGDGILKIEMHFLPDIYVPCDVCRGRRYNRETLEIRYKGKNIAEVLDMTVNQAMGYFERIGNIRDKLQTLIDVGLGYVHLGQSATTLSGGEAQRVKLARELSRRYTGRTVYILDEPTTGLHMEDVKHLLEVLNRLVDAGNTVIIIEHNLDVIKCADHIIDLGPEGGDQGGRVLATGTPEAIAAVPASHTGR